jgi:hypothetical protein
MRLAKKNKGASIIDFLLALIISTTFVLAFYKTTVRFLDRGDIEKAAMNYAKNLYHVLVYLETNKPVSCSSVQPVSTASLPSSYASVFPNAYYVQTCFTGTNIPQVTGVVLNDVQVVYDFDKEFFFWKQVEKYLQVYSEGKYKLYLYQSEDGKVYDTASKSVSYSEFLNFSIDLQPNANGFVPIVTTSYSAKPGYWVILVQGVVTGERFRERVTDASGYKLYFSNVGYSEKCPGILPTTQKKYFGHSWGERGFADVWGGGIFATYICIPVGVDDIPIITSDAVNSAIESLSTTDVDVKTIDFTGDYNYPCPADYPYCRNSSCFYKYSGFGPTTRYVYRHFVINYRNTYYEVFAYSGPTLNTVIASWAFFGVYVRSIGSPSDVDNDPVIVSRTDNFNSDCNFSFNVSQLFPVNAPQLNVP